MNRIIHDTLAYLALGAMFGAFAFAFIVGGVR